MAGFEKGGIEGMRKLSLMTMTLFMRIFFKFNLDHDMEDLREGYEEIMDMVQEAGYKAVDVTSLETESLGTDFILEVLQSHRLRVSSYIHFGQFAAMDADGLESRIELAKQGADIACRLETDVFMLVPQADADIENHTPEQIRGQMIRHWKEIAPYAKAKGLHVVVEDTPDLKLHFCKSDEVKAVLDAVPELELVYDSGNMILVEEDPAGYLETFKNRIGYVHLKDMRKAPAGSMMVDLAKDGTPLSTAPTGTGLIGLQEVIERLIEIGYQGGMTVEFFVDDDREYLKSLKRSREYVENFIPIGQPVTYALRADL